MIPYTIAASSSALRAIADRDLTRLAALATPRGRAAVEVLLRAGGELADAVRSWSAPSTAERGLAGMAALAMGSGSQLSSRRRGDRAMCSFAEIAVGQVAVVELVAVPNRWPPVWLLEDVRIVENREFWAFGDDDNGPIGGAMPPSGGPVAG